MVDMRTISSGLGLILLIICSSCDPEPEEGDGDDNENPTSRRAIIATAGAKPGGTSTLHSFDINSSNLNANAFRKENLSNIGIGLSELYLDSRSNSIVAVLRGNDRIRTVDPQTLALKETVNNLEDIHSVLRVDERSLYLSSGKEEGVVILNRKWKVRKIIPTGVKPEALAMFEDLVFVANNGGEIGDSTVTVIRGTADTVITQLPVLPGPSGLAIDDDNHLWVLCHGNIDLNDPTSSGVGGLFRYNLDTMQMAIDSSQAIQPDTVLAFTDNQLKPNDLLIDNQGGYLYYRQYLEPSSISRMSLNATEVSETPYLNGNFLSMALDDADGLIYTGVVPNSNPNTENGKVRIYTPEGDQQNEFLIGVNPVDFVFP